MPWSVADYSTTPDLNTSINGVDINEFCAAAGYNNALRQMMADIKAWTNAYGITYPISVGNGGTGATTAPAALTALGAFPAAGGGTVGGDASINGKWIRVGYGAHPFWEHPAMTVGKWSLQPMGSDPTLNPGEAVFEY